MLGWTIMRNLYHNKNGVKVTPPWHTCKKHMSDTHIVLKSPDLYCDTYLSTPQMVARSVTSQNNLKNM